MGLVIFGGGGFANEAYHYANDAIEAGNLKGPIRGVVAPSTPTPARHQKLDGCAEFRSRLHFRCPSRLRQKEKHREL